MAPYTAEGIQERERTDTSPAVDPTSAANTTKNRNSLTLKSTRLSSSNYELVGVVVHSGQASAGHYYSFIKERKQPEVPNRNRWFKFNDTTVEEFDMNDTTLEAECFGGTYKAKSYDTSMMANDHRIHKHIINVFSYFQPTVFLKLDSATGTATFSFTIKSRITRKLHERLVKEPALRT